MTEPTSPPTLTAAALAVLSTADATDKANLTRQLVDGFFQQPEWDIGQDYPPARPARPSRPLLLLPGDMPRRRAAGTVENRAALLHALAHIELNAIDLAWDLIARFWSIGWPRDFYADWLRVADDEARHFLMLQQRLQAIDYRYGDLPAHDGLWESAQSTAHDALARLAIVPLVLEARGLDVTPNMIATLERQGHADDAIALRTIYQDEIAHVAAGQRWFNFLAAQAGADPVMLWRDLVRAYFKGTLKPPFNHAARQQAGFWPDSYETMTIV